VVGLAAGFAVVAGLVAGFAVAVLDDFACVLVLCASAGDSDTPRNAIVAKQRTDVRCVFSMFVVQPLYLVYAQTPDKSAPQNHCDVISTAK
jgi:hypothetical protein